MLKNLRFAWWLTKAFFLRHGITMIWTIVISVFMALAGLKILPKVLTIIKPSRHFSTIAIIGKFRPGELPAVILDKLSLGLTQIDGTGRAIPGLARSWTVSEDGKSYVFHLNESKTWHDGTSLSAKDINIAIEHVRTEVVNNNTIKFSLEQPYAPFPTVLSKPLFKNRLVGTGHFRLIRLVQNGEFADTVTIENGVITEIYKFYPSSAGAITALKLGEVDEVRDLISTDDVPKLGQYKIKPDQHLDRYLAVLFNTQDKLLAEKSVRQALAYAIPDKPGGEDRVISPVSKASWAYNPLVKPYNWDIPQAKELLKGLEEINSSKLEISTFLPYLSRAEEIAAAWTDLGITTSVKVTLVLPTEFQILITGQQIPADPDQYIFWHSTQPTNLTKYANPKVDKLLEDGRETLDENKRQEIYRDFQRFLLEDPPAVFLGHITTYSVYRK